MKAAAHIPVLEASEVLGGGLEIHLANAAGILVPRADGLATRFNERLRKLGYQPRERKALAAVAPTALRESGNLAREFIEQVEYNGRRLAKLNLSPRRILRALSESRRLLAGRALPLAAPERAQLSAALEQWYSCVVLTLNNAFHQVAEAEAQTCHELFRHELESAGLDELLSRLLDSLVTFCRAGAGQVFLREGGSGLWVLRAATQRGAAPAGLGPGARVRVASPGSLARPHCSIRRGGTLRLPLDPAWRRGFQTCWSIPLASQGRLGGVIQFAFAQPYDWLPRELEVLSVAAERCELAAAKARLTEELAARESQIRELAGRVVQAEERERRRISAELHDEAGQSLLCVRLQLEMLERTLPAGAENLRSGLVETRKLTETTIVEIRRLIAALSPAVLDQLGLARALRQLASQVGRLQRLDIRIQLGSLNDVPRPIALAAYRLAQECLNNAARHSRASRVNLSASTVDGQLRLCVEDDGIGFRVEEALGRSGSFGLAGMSERASLLGGELQVHSRPGRGTRLSIWLPIRGTTRNHASGIE